MMMKKLFVSALALLLALTSVSALASDDGSAYDAFATFVNNTASSTYLNEVMSGAYASAPANTSQAQQMAQKLDQLLSVTTKDISVYVAEHNLSDTEVQDAYYNALSNVLDAELMLNPQNASRYADVKALLALQNNNASEAKSTGSTSISKSSSSSSSSGTAKSSSSSSSSGTAKKSSSSSSKKSSAYNTPDTPDRNTKNTPNTPDRNTKNTPDTPDRNTKNSPDRNT